jgi:hypothetical protein
MFEKGSLVNMKKLVLVALTSALLTLSASPVQAVNKEGAKCSTAGKIVKVASKRLVCARVAKTLKWVVVPSSTTTTVAPTTTVAATTTTTTIPASQRKAVVTLKRSYGTFSGVSLKVSYTVEGNKDLRCTTLSKILGEDFNGTRISYIYDIVQTTPEICTITVEYIGERDGDTREIILSAAPTFSITDTDGVVQTTLLGSPQSIWATRPAS